MDGLIKRFPKEIRRQFQIHVGLSPKTSISGNFFEPEYIHRLGYLGLSRCYCRYVVFQLCKLMEKLRCHTPVLEVECLFSKRCRKTIEARLIVGDVSISEVVGPREAIGCPEHREEFLGAEVVRIKNEAFT